MSQGSEPSIVEYARYHGLIQDHLAFHPLRSIPLLEEATYLATIEESPDICISHSTLGENAREEIMYPERMFVDMETAKILASTSQSARIPHRFDEDVDMPTMCCKRLKHELPLLHTDHESDLRSFTKRFEPDLQNEFLPLESLNEDADEGFAWPTKYFDMSFKIWQKLNTERLEISAVALRYLAEVVSHGIVDDSKAVFDIEERGQFTHPKKKMPTPVTPPLLPMSPPHIPFSPPSEVGHLALLSEHSSPTKEQLRKIEQKIFAQDAVKISRKMSYSSPQSSDPMLLDSDNIGEIFSPLKGMQDLPSSPPDDRLPRRALKVEVPLVFAEPESHFQRTRKAISFSETWTEIVPTLPEPFPDFHEDEIMDEINTFFDKSIKPIAAKAERTIEQEQLQEADTMRRVSVPIMDFSLPRAPWDVTTTKPHRQAGCDSQGELLQDMRKQYFKDDVWLLSGRIERELQWTPFPAAMGRIELREVIIDDGKLATFLTQGAPIETESLTWKPPGIRLFDKNKQYDEEELGEGSFAEETDLQSLVRKRKMELLEHNATFAKGHGDRARSNGTMNVTRSDSSSWLGSLDDFMRVRTGVAGVKQAPTSHDRPERHKFVKPATDADVHYHHERGLREYELDPEERLGQAVPENAMSNERRSFIISAELLKNRKIMRQIQRLLPAAEFIERDWMLHIKSQEVPQNLKQGFSTTPPDPSADEADILISPGTALILTSLQKIKQQSLPGKSTQSTIRERIKRTASRYENLIILISTDHLTSDNNQILPMRDLDHSDCEAIAIFTAFCSALEDEIQTMFVPGGSEELSRWIITMMIKHSTSCRNIQLIQDITIWELFLRRVGLNAFAAQAVLAELNEKNMPESENRDSGSTAFVKMSADERLTRFERIFGGRRLLSKINVVLETRW